MVRVDAKTSNRRVVTFPLMPPKAGQWTHRVHFGSGVGLQWGIELWKWDPSLFESSDGIVASLSWSTHPMEVDAICFEATRSLLDDVVDAAGGVEPGVGSPP